MSKQCRRCDTKGGTIFMLDTGVITKDRLQAWQVGWKWTAVTCGRCGAVHGDVSGVKKETRRTDSKKGVKSREVQS